MRVGDAGRRTRIANSKESVGFAAWLEESGDASLYRKRLPMAESVICIRSDRGMGESSEGVMFE